MPWSSDANPWPPQYYPTIESMYNGDVWGQKLLQNAVPTAEEAGIYTPPAPTVEPPHSGGNGSGSNNITVDKYKGVALSEKDLEYNAGMVLPSYFSGRFTGLNGQSSDIQSTVAGGDVTNVFNSTSQSKGMIVTWIPKNPTDIIQNIPYNKKTGGASSDVIENRYGFQFHYNPTKVMMTYNGQPNVDLGYISSGQDPFHPAGTEVTKSTITFSIPLNRVADFQYYDATTGQVKPAYAGIYGNNAPSAAAQKKIWEYGTMYDLEYLLAACLGFKMQSSYREMTSDIGYVSGRPIELILGKRLKYQGMITSISVEHSIFDQRMVPILSTLNLQISIMPDITNRIGS